MAGMTADQIDDLLYLARTGSLQELKEDLSVILESRGSATDISYLKITDEESATTHLLTTTIRDSDTGNTLLHMAAANGHDEVLEYLISLEDPRSASTTESKEPCPMTILDTPNKAGNTPLHYAALNGHLDSVQFLLKHGADHETKNAAGKTAKEEAEAGEKDEVVAYLDAKYGVTNLEDVDGAEDEDVEKEEVKDEKSKDTKQGDHTI